MHLILVLALQHLFCDLLALGRGVLHISTRCTQGGCTASQGGQLLLVLDCTAYCDYNLVVDNKACAT